MKKCACKGSFLDRLIQPYILLTVNHESLHGFSIYKRLMKSEGMDYTGTDPTGFYRTLKKMESAGLLFSRWDTAQSAQPKKIYSITAEGKECLAHWKTTLILYQAEIEQLTQSICKSLEETTNETISV